MNRVYGMRRQVYPYFAVMAVVAVLLLVLFLAVSWMQDRSDRRAKLRLAADQLSEAVAEREQSLRELLTAATFSGRYVDAVGALSSQNDLPAMVAMLPQNPSRQWRSAEWLTLAPDAGSTSRSFRYQIHQGDIYGVLEQRRSGLAALLAFPLAESLRPILRQGSLWGRLEIDRQHFQLIDAGGVGPLRRWLSDSQSLTLQAADGPDIRLVLYASPKLPIRVLAAILAGLILLLLIAALLARLLSEQLSRPLRQLSSQLQRYADGEQMAPLTVDSRVVDILSLQYALDAVFGVLRRREKNLRYRATHDLLTGMKNQNELLRIVGQRISDARAHNRIFHLIGINILNFREINDMFGPDIADSCLVNIGAFLEQEHLVAARFYRGGIVVVKDGPPDEVAAVVLAMQLTRHHGIKNVDIELNVCTAIVGFPDDASDAPVLLRRLEIALDGARRAPYRFQRYKHGQEENYVKRLNMVEELRQAMLDWHSGLQVFYQPKLNLRAGQVDRMEALVRWNHPKYGNILPSEFIPLAEQAGLISSLSSWVITRVCEQIAGWRERGLDIQVAVNLSVQDMSHPELVDVIEKHRRKYELPAKCLAFEITESELMENPQEAIRLLKTFREQGYCLAIDDFGTGYSSLAQVKHMPVNEIKIDQEFVRHLPRDGDDQKIVRTTLALAHNFGLEAVAEGVEDLDTLELLVRWGCGWAQGYYISPAMPGVEVVDWVDEFHARHGQQTDALSRLFASEVPTI